MFYIIVSRKESWAARPPLLSLLSQEPLFHLIKPTFSTRFEQPVVLRLALQVGGVVGGLSGLTFVLAVALLIATGSINQWRCCARWGLALSSSGAAGNAAAGSEDNAGAASAQPMLSGAAQPSSYTPRSERGMGMGGVLSLPRTAGSPPGTAPGSVDGGGSGLASPRSSYSMEGWLTGRSTGSQRGPNSDGQGRRSGGGGHSSEEWGSVLGINAAWRDCLIDPAKVLVLRRPNGQPWRLGGGSFGQVGGEYSCITSRVASNAVFARFLLNLGWGGVSWQRK